MVEYLYNCIRATAGDKVEISAIIETDAGEPITEHCHIMLFDKDNLTLLSTIDGQYVEETGLWQFALPAELTAGKLGRYWYRICAREGSLCFKQPIYFCV